MSRFNWFWALQTIKQLTESNLIKNRSKMPQKPEEEEKQEQPKNEKEKSDENDINTCAGGLTEKQVKELQEELDRAKEDNSFSSTSRCLISWKVKKMFKIRNCSYRQMK